MPQQNITCDCGVYVCRYAYNMYLVRNRTFTKSDIDSSFEFITKSAEFKFIDDDIYHIRLGLKKLVQTMSVLYKGYKEILIENRNKICDVPIIRNDEIKDSETMKINLENVSTHLEENKNSKVKDEVITDKNDNTECGTNEEKDNKDIIETKDIDNNDKMNIISTVSKDNISLSNDIVVKKVNKMEKR